MKFLTSQLTYLLTQQETRRNLQALLRYLAFLVLVMALYTVLFRAIMLLVEDQQHSWLSGFYWTLITGDVDSVDTYRALRVEHANGVLANLSDFENTNVTLTIREQSPTVPIIAIAEEAESVDLLELAAFG